LFVPVDFGSDAHLGVSDDEIVDQTLVGPASIESVVELLLARDQGGTLVALTSLRLR